VLPSASRATRPYGQVSEAAIQGAIPTPAQGGSSAGDDPVQVCVFQEADHAAACMFTVPAICVRSSSAFSFFGFDALKNGGIRRLTDDLSPATHGAVDGSFVMFDLRRRPDQRDIAHGRVRDIFNCVGRLRG
jgi:hypothetical protein